jgi:hypothetical protein
MSLSAKKYSIAQGATFTEVISLVRTTNGAKAPIPANEVSQVKVTLRRSPNRTAPARLTKILARSQDAYPFSLTADETEALNTGLHYADVLVEFASGVSGYPLRLMLEIQSTTTQA